MNEAPTRPVLRYHGGKWLLADWIVSHFPPHRVYVEPFGGGASVLLQKRASYAEVYNDLDSEIVSLFEVLRDPMLANRLSRLLEMTPFARDEFEAAYQVSRDPVENARRVIIRSHMGFASSGVFGRATGFRSNSTRSGTTPAKDWKRYPEVLAAVTQRLRGVVIENRPAVDVMLEHDGPKTLHYVDPPYVPESRSRGNSYCTKHKYRHELSNADHEALLATLKQLRGMVVLSGYASEIYESALQGWERFERASNADGARARMEVLWLSPSCAAAVSGRLEFA